MACLGGSRPPPFYYEIWSKEPLEKESRVWKPAERSSWSGHGCHRRPRRNPRRSIFRKQVATVEPYPRSPSSCRDR
eukprot:1078830-Pyramimonas_sp.AAC.1